MRWDFTGLLVVAMLVLAGLGAIVFGTAPAQTAPAVRFLFFPALFISSWAVTALLWAGLAWFFTANPWRFVPRRFFGKSADFFASLRRGLLTAILFTVAVVAYRLDRFGFKNLLIAIVVILLFEAISIIIIKRHRSNPYNL